MNISEHLEKIGTDSTESFSFGAPFAFGNESNNAYVLIRDFEEI